MELNGDEPIRKSKPLTLKSVAKTSMALQAWDGFRGSSSKEKKDDQKGCFNCKKPNHFIADYPEVQKDKSKKVSFQRDIFINKFKKSIMATCDELDNEQYFEKDEIKVNLALTALTYSEAESDSNPGSDSNEEDEVFSKLSCSN
ncbi:hypothetical protein KIW84_033926 [Lathyrus oleraceus]|uniref:Serine/threonine protein kinase SRPK1 n=1 Tax=Pisum sativum TaxID=3888 RepID=A0A9D5B4G4_PEA|nr:hypothetical protein KIW84_033926 [Pisum sativum]